MRIKFCKGPLGDPQGRENNQEVEGVNKRSPSKHSKSLFDILPKKFRSRKTRLYPDAMHEAIKKTGQWILQ